MKPLGKVMLTPKGDYDSGTTYDVLDLVRYDHKSWISLKQQTGVAPTQGADWQLYTEDGNGIVNVSYVGVDPTDPDGLTDIYEIAFTNTTPFQFKIRNGKDGSGGGGGASSWSDLKNKPFNTLGDDFNVESNILKLATSITTKLSALDNGTTDIGNVLTADGNNTFSWKKAKGGHDMLTYSDTETVDDGIQRVLTNTLKENVVDARILKYFSNTYKIRKVIELTDTMLDSGNCMGKWDDTTTYENWFQSDDLIVTDEDDDVELQFMFQVDDSKPIVLGGYRWETSLGKICIKFGADVEAGTVIAIDIIHTRRV